MKKYVEDLEDTQKIKLSKQEKNYINLLTDLSYQMDVDKNGFHNNMRIEKIAVLLDKIKSDPCYGRHNRFVPSFLKRRLSVGSEDKLSALIAEFDAMQTDKKWEELKKNADGTGDKAEICIYNRYHMYSFEYVHNECAH